MHFSDHWALRAGSFQTEVSQDHAIFPSDGFGISARCTLSGLPGNTLIAFIFPFSFWILRSVCDPGGNSWVVFLFFNAVDRAGSISRGTRRSAALAWRPRRSSPSDGWRPRRRRCRRGSIRRKSTRSRQCGSVWNFVEIAEYRPAALFVLQEDAGQAAREFGRHFPQVHHVPEPVGNSTLKSVAQVVMELLQRLDQQKIHREPDRSAPVGVAAEQSGGRFGRLVVHAMLAAVRPAGCTDGRDETATRRGCRKATGTRSRPA